MRMVTDGRVNWSRCFTVFFAIATWSGLAAQGALAQSNPVVIENLLPGSADWDIPTDSLANDSAGQIKGYASEASVNKGDSITMFVSVSQAQTYTIDVYRIGWYQGLGGRLMQQIGPLNGIVQTPCPIDSSTGLIECHWTPSYTLATQASWTSGIYLAVLTNAQSNKNYITFVVRDDTRPAALLYQQPVSTHQAYNNYPNDGRRGKSLYDFNSNGSVTVGGTRAAVKVSFDRPYSDSGISDDVRSWEVNFVRWIEKSGYDVAYSTSVDTHASGARLINYRGFLAVGHDEYWSKSMFDSATAARDGGVNLAFFSADSIYWQVRFEPSSLGAENRVMVCYRDPTIDPVPDPAQKTSLWRDPPVNRPEQALVGVQYSSNPPFNSGGGYAAHVVTNSGHWIYAGTGFNDGDSAAGIVGYEADRLFTEFPGPDAVSGTYALLSHSPYQGDYANSSIYQAPSGAWVFGSGTISWSWALDAYGAGANFLDARIQRTTANLLDRFVAAGQADFLLSAVPSSRTVTPAASTVFDIAINPFGGFAESVTLALNGLPAGASAGFAPNPTTDSSVLTVSTSPTTPSGTYAITVTGASGNLARSTAVTLSVDTGVRVTSPNDSVTWQAGTRQNVTFSHSQGVGQPMNIDISRDDGSTWTPVATITTTAATTGTYSWLVSGPPTSQARVRVTAASNALSTDASDVNFMIINPVVKVTAPNTAVNWRIGEARTTAFSQNFGVGQIARIDVSRDGGVSWVPAGSMTTTAATSGSYLWTVSGPATKQGRIRVRWDADASVNDMSDVNFTILPRTTVTAPNTAVNWGAGSMRTVTWSHNLGAGGLVNIEFSPDNGATWSILASAVPSLSATSGSFQGPMPAVPTTLALIRVSPANDATAGDVSNAPFTLSVPTITVTSPNTNVAWATGSNQSIKWNHNLGTLEAVKIEIARDGVNYTEVVAASAPNTAVTSGAYSWNVTSPTTTLGRIRVTWLRNPAVSDVSNITFRIR